MTQEALARIVDPLKNSQVNVLAPGCSSSDIEREEDLLGIRFTEPFRDFFMLRDGGLLFESEEIFGLVMREDVPRETMRQAIEDHAPLLARTGLEDPIPFHAGLGLHVGAHGQLGEIDKETAKATQVGESPLSLLQMLLAEYRYHYPETAPSVSDWQRQQKLKGATGRRRKELRKRGS